MVPVERYNKTLEAQLSMFVDQNQSNWDQLIPLMLMAYHTAIHETTSCTPAKLMVARELRLPIDLPYGRPEEEPVQQQTTTYANYRKRWRQCTTMPEHTCNCRVIG